MFAKARPSEFLQFIGREQPSCIARATLPKVAKATFYHQSSSSPAEHPPASCTPSKQVQRDGVDKGNNVTRSIHQQHSLDNSATTCTDNKEEMRILKNPAGAWQGDGHRKGSDALEWSNTEDTEMLEISEDSVRDEIYSISYSNFIALSFFPMQERVCDIYYGENGSSPKIDFRSLKLLDQRSCRRPPNMKQKAKKLRSEIKSLSQTAEELRTYFSRVMADVIFNTGGGTFSIGGAAIRRLLFQEINAAHLAFDKIRFESTETWMELRVNPIMFIHMVGGLVGMLIGTLLSSITKRKSRRRIHGQAALTSLLLWSSPATATPVGDTLNPAMAMKDCSSFLDGLHLELNKQLAFFTNPQPPFPRSFPPSTLLLTNFLTTTTTVLLFSILYPISKPHTKLSLVSGLLLSSLAGAAFAKDIPDLVFRYLFFGINAALICGALVASVLGTSTVVERRVVGDVEGGGQEKGGRRG